MAALVVLLFAGCESSGVNPSSQNDDAVYLSPFDDSEDLEFLLQEYSTRVELSYDEEGRLVERTIHIDDSDGNGVTPYKKIVESYEYSDANTVSKKTLHLFDEEENLVHLEETTYDEYDEEGHIRKTTTNSYSKEEGQGEILEKFERRQVTEYEYEGGKRTERTEIYDETEELIETQVDEYTYANGDLILWKYMEFSYEGGAFTGKSAGEYTYDADGNRTSETRTIAEYVYEDAVCTGSTVTKSRYNQYGELVNKSTSYGDCSEVDDEG